ncbi:hypothetical protein QAD02_006257, partial [Eretmocerus hayati]
MVIFFVQDVEVTTPDSEEVTLADHTSLPLENKTTNWFDKEEDVPLNRSSRGLIDFKGMFGCVGTCSAWNYNNYGCWCGKGGSGPVVDKIDQCCKDHDLCYERTGCIGIFNYFVSPLWRCTPDGVEC